jgi:hypothetical protein
MITSFKNPVIMRILRTTERHGAGWREQNFIPDNEAVGQVKTQNRRPKMGRLFSAFSTETLARGGGGIV